MKKLPVFALLMVLSTLITAQNLPKKYVLIEHFTNSRCGVCAGKNPVFFNLIEQAQYAPEVHHIAIHPQFPYSNCVFYQANTTDNTARVSAYTGIFGTPTVVLNGVVNSGGSQLLTAAKLNTLIGQTSSLNLKVTETGTGSNRSVNVKARTVGTIAQGNYKLYLALVEKTVTQTTPNGEPVHHDVLRKLLPAADGFDFVPGVDGATIEFNADYAIANTWNADEMYVVAFVQNTVTKEVLNSGTKFDTDFTSGTEDLVVSNVKISPNPVTDQAFAQLSDDQVQSVVVFASNGQRISVETEIDQQSLSIATANLPSGVYYVKITGAKGVYGAKFVK